MNASKSIRVRVSSSWWIILRSLILVAGGLIHASLGLGAQEKPGRWVVVCPPAFQAALTPLIEHRRAEGFEVLVLPSTNVLTSEQIRAGDGLPLRDWIKEQCRETNPPSYILLAGEPVAADPAKADSTVVPSMAGTIGRMAGKPSDFGYCLPNEAGLPSVAVGRFPARTTDELRGMVEKTLRLERQGNAGTLGNRIVLIGGNPGGGRIAEMMVEQAAAPRLERLHPAWSIEAIFNSALSRFFVPGSRAREASLAAMRRGQIFTVFAGHSSPSAMWLEGNHFLTRDDWTGMSLSNCPGVFFTCGCFGCQWTGRDGTGYGVAAMRNPNGPVAVIGAIGESYSAPGQLALDGLMRGCSTVPIPVRLSDYWLAVQAGLADGPIDDLTFKLYDGFDGSGGKVPLATQRTEHLEMWLLFGDPALRLPIVPVDLSFTVSGQVTPEQKITVEGTLPVRLEHARVRVTVERLVSSVPADREALPANTPENAAARERVTISNHERSNNVVLMGAEAEVKGTRFSCALALPEKIPWPKLVIRAHAKGTERAGLGVVTVQVVP